MRYAVLLLFFASFGLIYYLFVITPTGFVPSEDKGTFMVSMNLKPGSSIERTTDVRKVVEKIVADIPGVADVIAVDGYNIISQTLDGSSAMMFVTLIPWDQRTAPGMDVESIIKQVFVRTAKISDASVVALNMPGITGLGNVGGFDFRLQDYLAGDMETFTSYAQTIIAEANADPRISRAFTVYNPSYPMYSLDIDRKKANALGVDIATLFGTLQIYFGSFYVNDFTKFGKVFRVFVQADKRFRSEKNDINKIYLKNKQGKMVPISALLTIRDRLGPQNISHYNLYRSIQINGDAAEGYSSGEAMAAMEEIAARVLPTSFGYSWSGMSFQEKLSGNAQSLVFIFVALVVFLVLSAQYESWILPLMINLKWNIFSGLATTAKTEQAKLALLQSRSSFDDARLLIRQEASNAQISLLKSYANVRLSQALSEAAKEKFGQAQKRYENGLSDYIELQEARQGYINANAKLVSNYYDYFIAVATLDRAIGR